MSEAYNYTQWNYGYTLDPSQPQIPAAEKEEMQDQGPPGEEVKNDKNGGASSDAAAPNPAGGEEGVPGEFRPNAMAAGKNEDGEIVERCLGDILRGRNPVVWCNDMSKMLNLAMEWEQISETGPPHDKTFTWSLKMGELSVTGSANSKKLAKTKAAEEMAKKIDQTYPNRQPYKRPYGMPPHHMRFGPPHMRMPYGFRPMMGPRGPFCGPPMGMRGPPPPWVQANMAKRMRFMGGGPPPMPMESAAAAEAAIAQEQAASLAKVAQATPKQLNPCQNNPISKLYEYVKKRKMPEPIFEVVHEEVTNTKRTAQGFNLKRTEFTMKCTFANQEYHGKGPNKKAAKQAAAAACWAEVGAGIGQDSITNMLQEQRDQQRQQREQEIHLLQQQHKSTNEDEK